MPKNDYLACTGLVVEVGPPGESPKTMRRLARKVSKRRLRGEWTVEPRSDRHCDFLLKRMSGRTIRPGQAFELAATLAADRDVRSAEPAFRTTGLEPDIRRASAELGSVEPKSSSGSRPHLPCARSNPVWSLEMIRAFDAWALTPKPGGKSEGRGIVVGHPDTGYTRHPEIWEPAGNPRVLATRGYDFEDNKADPRDPLTGNNPSHGTSTASVIISDHNPSDEAAWVTGVVPKARLIPIRVSDGVVHFDFGNVTRAIYLAIDQKVHVISMSLGGPFKSDFLERAIDRAIDAGIIVRAAAGNVWPWVVYPAKYRQVIAVAAVNCAYEPWKDSAHGKAVDISAPGESVWRARRIKKKGKPGQDVVRPSSGTSYAIATTAGACALWLAHHGRRKLIQRYGASNLAAVFREVLTTYGFFRPPGWGTDEYGVGILRADELLKAPLPASPPAAGLAPKSIRGPRPVETTVQRLADYFPGMTQGELRTSLERVLRVKGRALDELLEEHGDELVVHVATDPNLRDSIHRGRKKRGAVMPKGMKRRDLFPTRRCSRQLTKALQLT